MYLMGFNLSVAVAVGFIALAGVAAETGVVMLIYRDQAFTEMVERRKLEGFTASVSLRYHRRVPAAALLSKMHRGHFS
jgi:copper/silver efflux system protein